MLDYNCGYCGDLFGFTLLLGFWCCLIYCRGYCFLIGLVFGNLWLRTAGLVCCGGLFSLGFELMHVFVVCCRLVCWVNSVGHLRGIVFYYGCMWVYMIVFVVIVLLFLLCVYCLVMLLFGGFGFRLVGLGV